MTRRKLLRMILSCQETEMSRRRPCSIIGHIIYDPFDRHIGRLAVLPVIARQFFWRKCALIRLWDGRGRCRYCLFARIVAGRGLLSEGESLHAGHRTLICQQLAEKVEGGDRIPQALESDLLHGRIVLAGKQRNIVAGLCDKMIYLLSDQFCAVYRDLSLRKRYSNILCISLPKNLSSANPRQKKPRQPVKTPGCTDGCLDV